MDVFDSQMDWVVLLLSLPAAGEAPMPAADSAGERSTIINELDEWNVCFEISH